MYVCNILAELCPSRGHDCVGLCAVYGCGRVYALCVRPQYQHQKILLLVETEGQGLNFACGPPQSSVPPARIFPHRPLLPPPRPGPARPGPSQTSATALSTKWRRRRQRNFTSSSKGLARLLPFFRVPIGSVKSRRAVRMAREESVRKKDIQSALAFSKIPS